ncbi:MAG: alpha-mannosidase, partial [Cellulosilyticaceae bacterium]
KKVLGIFDYGNTGHGNNYGFESLLYVNGAIYQGVDSNHKEVFFEEEVMHQPIELTFRLWSGLEGGGVQKPQEHCIKQADLAWLDEEVDQFYYLSKMVYETIKILDENNPIQVQLRLQLDKAFKCIDWSYPGSEAFYETVYEASKMLNTYIDNCDKKELVNVTCVGHTHIDVAWLWRLKHTREKCSRSFSTVLRLMEQYPEYIFLQTQPQLYDYIKQDFPDIYEKIKARVDEGRWEVDGGMWLEADCNLTSGESLTRQILIGSKFIKEEFGQDVEYLWLPDVFGYSWALPQILKKSGIDTFMTIKISWNQYNRMPHDTFKWRGIDGSEVITHFLTTPDPWSEKDSWIYTYNGQLSPKIVKGVYDNYSEKQLTNDMLVAYGFGDGGGGVNREMLENRRQLDRIPGLPNTKMGTAKDYFRGLKDKIQQTDQYVHTWDGELYLEYHRGTYTSQAYNKKMNRHLEFRYREVEWLNAMEGVLAQKSSVSGQERLTDGWKIILRNQFHDIIPGSSIKEVYEDSRKEYAEAEYIAQEVEEKTLKALVDDEAHTYTIMNATNWDRSELVEIEETAEGRWLDEEGNVLQAVKEDKWYVQVDQVPAMGWKTIFFEEEVAPISTTSFEVKGYAIETPFYSVSMNDKGQLEKLYDKSNQRQVLAGEERGNVLQLFEDKPLAFEAWDIDVFYQEKMREITNLTNLSIKEHNALRLVVTLEWTFMSSTIKQDVIFYAHSRRIDFKTWVDWHEKKQLLKVAFPVDIRTNYATYDIQYGNVRRANHWNTSWDLAKFETVAHKWVDLSERNYGVSLLNDCKYGHDIKDNVMRLTLLRAGTYPDPDQDQGEHTFTYSLLPHAGDFVSGQTVQNSWWLHQPLKAVKGKSHQLMTSLITIDNEQVELDAIKWSEDSKYLVIRLHDYAGATQNVTIDLGFDTKGWMEADLMERPIEDVLRTEKITLKVKPYELKTILVVVEQGEM